MNARHYVVMGVSGCGKTSVGQGLAASIGAEFVDGDDLHPPANVAKMARGEPLDDADRGPWLEAVAARMKAGTGSVVMGCSALKRRYRDIIRDGAGRPVMFLHLAGSRDLIAARMSAREGHFMPLSLLDSQFTALEPPASDELALTVDIDRSEAEIVAWLVSEIAGR
ncbi:gluconokinase [uncultured Roseobacter sp.]|uniref:gluconokinase n=1 Tax=uncultured Roseobacter sp. TaxID=114847 RepID=UPI00261CE03C|nr:gluconokinase [uncultured Roseobacter sp.]